jgi:hypothetical protein
MWNFFPRVFFKLKQALWAARVRAARKVLAGEQAWLAMDRLGIPGFGTELLRVDFRPDGANVPAWNEASPAFGRLAKILDQAAARQAEYLERCVRYADIVTSWPAHALEHSPLPWTENEFLSGLDMLALYGMVRETRPRRYVEIGCGISTRVARAAIRDGALPTEMICVDPAPRVELPGAEIRHLRKTLESAVGEILALVQTDSILFFDGSHRCFPGSDVTLFFVELLPALPPGVIVHIHDIFLPGDYPANAASRYWSEQYLLATWLLGGSQDLEILLPGARLETRAGGLANIPERLRSRSGTTGRFSSFWLRKR